MPEVRKIPPRLFGILARKARVGVLLRRGPSEWVRLIRWNTGTDDIERGQWLHARVYERRCDLSPDGSLLVYFCRDGRTAVGNYTAVSKPPWFTALALWPQDHTWRGGGLFLDDRTLFLNQCSPLDALPGKEPRGLRVVNEQPYAPPGNNEDLGVYEPHLVRDGWECAERGDVRKDPCVHVWVRKKPGEPISLIKRSHAGVNNPPGTGCYWDQYAVDVDGTILEMPDADWADFDQKGRLVFTRAGCLWRAGIKKDHLDEKLIADFNDEEPKAIASPASARRWRSTGRNA